MPLLKGFGSWFTVSKRENRAKIRCLSLTFWSPRRLTWSLFPPVLSIREKLKRCVFGCPAPVGNPQYGNLIKFSATGLIRLAGMMLPGNGVRAGPELYAVLATPPGQELLPLAPHWVSGS